ncbi:MAG: ABC transporter permease [Deltaproteobacteria bacterium]|nr:ABC transporter permease [Deltaproteobacteria bacterium]
MRPRALAELVARDLQRSVRTFSVAALGIAVGIATLSFFLALSQGLKEVVLGRIFPNDRVEVIPPESSVGAALSIFTRARPPGITAEQVEALRRVPGVRDVLPKMRLAFPSSGRGGRPLLPRDIGVAELLADGVDPSLVRPDLSSGARFEDPEGRSSRRPCAADAECPADERCDFPSIPRAGQPPPPGLCQAPIPVVVSPYLIEVFDGAIAPAHGLPRIGRLLAGRAEGMVFEWDLGRAGLGNAAQGTPRRTHGVLVGVSPRAVELGLTVPLPVARRLNREYAGDDAAALYSSAVVFLEDPARMTDVSFAVRDQRLAIRASGAEQMGLLIKVLTLILLFTSVVAVVIAALNIAHAFGRLIAERRGELGLLRALGASQRDLQALVLVQAASLGLVSTLAGLGLARLAAFACDRLAAGGLPAFPFKPEHWFVFSLRDVLGAVLFGVGACVLSALAPAWRASRVEPAEALSSGV